MGKRCDFLAVKSTMRLFEAILEANHRAAAGSLNAGLHQEAFADLLPTAERRWFGLWYDQFRV